MSNYGDEGGPKFLGEMIAARKGEHDRLAKRLGEMMRGIQKPAGFKALSKDDKGPMVFAVGADGGKVFLRFHEPMDWLAMDPEDAIALAEGLMNHAREAARVTGRPLKITFPY